MWSLVQLVIEGVKSAFQSFSKKPEPEKVPEPVDSTAAQDLVSPKKKGK